MLDSSVLFRAFKTLLAILWLVFLCSGPVMWAWILFSSWPPDYGEAPRPIINYLEWNEIIAALSAFGLIFWRWRKAILPAATWVLIHLLLFSPLGYAVSDAGFFYYIHSVSNYVQNHCHPMNFAQNGKIYSLGLCDLSVDKTGQSGFNFVYDTSGDTGRFYDLNSEDKKVFVNAVRKYFNDDPNEIFEISNFSSTRYGEDFYQLTFNDTDSQGFEPVYGPPPPNPKNPYPRMFW